MTLRELLRHRFQASSGNQATFAMAHAADPTEPNAHRVVIVSRWQFMPSVADIGEARELIVAVEGFQCRGTSTSQDEARRYIATGLGGNPANN
jgi:hypothetical protein